MNNILQKFHRYALSRIVWPFSIIIGLIFALGWRLAPDNVWTKLLSPVTSAAAVGGTFLFIEKIIRKHLWRIAYPELDFDGTWNGHTEYCKSECSTDIHTIFEPFKKEHEIKFKQDCLSVRVDYDETEAYVGWNSTVATLFNEQGKTGLRYAYEVKYRQGENRDVRLPKHSKGLEELTVVNSEEGQKPKRVTGTFAHLSDGPKPIYSGTVAFDRKIEQVPNNLFIWILHIIVNFWLKPPADK